jgi:hypothetical protein
MSAKRADPLDELYRAHPSEFVAARDALAKELREKGDRGEAAEVKKLKRPSAAAWLLNAVALERPKPLRDFAKASEALEKAQARALEGGDTGKWRAATAREREAAEAVLDAAEEAAGDAGHPATKQALDNVDDTLRAAAADAELREQLLAGRLERERSAATIGTLDLATAPPSGADKGKGSDSGAREKESTRKRETAQAAREVKRLERQVSEAEGREAHRRAEVDQAAEALRREKSELAAAKRETAGLKRELKAAQKRAKG